MQKKVSFKSNKGYLLRGVLHIPRGRGPWPAVVVQHGFTSDYNDVLVKAISSQLEKSGLVVLRFSFSGHKFSGGTYKNILISQFIKDINSAINFLSCLPKVRKYRIGIVGHSMGAYSALLAANILQKSIRAVVSISSYFDLDALMHKYETDGSVEEIGPDYWKIWGYKINNNHFKERIYLNRKYTIQDIHCPALIIHGENDDVVQAKDAKSIYKLLGEPKGLKIIKSGSHSFKKNKLQQKQIANLCASWCKKYLAFKVSRVVNVFIQYKDKVLILKRSQKVGTHRGMWCSVGGFIDDGRTVLQMARQEVQEELGLKKINGTFKLGRLFKFNEPKRDRIWQINPVLIKLKTKPKIKLDWENTDYRWVKPNQVKKFKTVPMLDEDLRRLKLID